MCGSGVSAQPSLMVGWASLAKRFPEGGSRGWCAGLWPPHSLWLPACGWAPLYVTLPLHVGLSLGPGPTCMPSGPLLGESEVRSTQR